MITASPGGNIEEDQIIQWKSNSSGQTSLTFFIAEQVELTGIKENTYLACSRDT